jgi:GTP-binding protein Era
MSETCGSRSGVVALVGWTNVGKSTLLNRLVGEKVAAVSDVAQTTRTPIIGLVHVPGRGQIAFADTPGLHRPRHRMNRNMLRLLHRTLPGSDVVVLVIDAERGIGAGDHEAARLVCGSGLARLAVLNKIDRVTPKSRLLPLMRLTTESWGFDTVLPVSALSGEGCPLLIEQLLVRLPVGPPLYPAEQYTDQSERALAAEWIREKLLKLTRQELPHATAVIVEHWQEADDGLVRIEATVLVERESQKPIVIGKAGQLLKQIGTEARAELERLLGRRVYLGLRVKTREHWRDDERTLRDLGLQ